MNWNRIKALIYRYLLFMRHDMARILDTFYWPLIDLVVWGFLTVYLSQTNFTGYNLATALISGIILWTLVYSLSRDIAVSFLDDLWDRNVINLYCSPLKPSEFLAASFLVALFRVMLTTIFMLLIAFIFYGVNTLVLGIYFFVFFLLLVIFSFSLGVFATTLILRFGPSAEIIAWSLPAVLSPFSAVLFPLSVLPETVRLIAGIFPTPYIFECMRGVLLHGNCVLKNLMVAGLLDVLYVMIAAILFFYVFDRIRQDGTISRFS